MTTPSTVPRGRKDRLSHIRRQSNLETSADLSKDVSLQENDDEQERNCRRQMRVLDDQEKNLNSPSTPSGRRLVLGTALSGLSNEELSEHYKECVRLSTENKITKKNAFQLHLIDYMADTIKKSGADMNFQVASCALDASAKIYGYRVDALEADTCKLASDLGRSHKNTDENDVSSQDTGIQDNLDNKRKRKVKKSAKIEQNLRNITLDKIERHVDSDSFRSQMSSGFHEQGVAGLFVFNLPFIDDRCTILLDSCTKPPSLDGGRMLDRNNQINISSFKSIMKDIINQKLSIDKTFHNFDFKHMDMEEISLKENSNNSQPLSQNDPEAFIFNEEEIVEPDDDNNGFDLADVDELEDDQVEITVAGAGANATDKGRLHPGLRLENINDTIGFLTAKPSEYSYYDPKLMSAWAGPNHWRFLPFNRRPNNEVPRVKRKQNQIHPLIDFDAKPFELTHTETKNNLTKAALQRWSKEKNELPFDHHYNIEHLGKSMLNPSLWIRSLKKVPQPIEADAGDVGYNYDNPADKSNYCGADGDSSDGEDHGPCTSSSPDVFGGFQQNQDMEFSFTQGQGETQNQAVPFSGENLVQQPYKIDKPFLAYEKTAKKIDAKKIKRAMWTILSNCDQEEEKISMTGSISFSHLYKEIPKHISEAAAKNMSIPIALVTFLHLCNEKVLCLAQEDMSDFKIQQG